MDQQHSYCKTGTDPRGWCAPHEPTKNEWMNCPRRIDYTTYIISNDMCHGIICTKKINQLMDRCEMINKIDFREHLGFKKFIPIIHNHFMLTGDEIEVVFNNIYSEYCDDYLLYCK